MVNSIKNKAVTNYWHEFYVVEGLCSLCGNSGIVDTTNMPATPKGLNVGRQNFCICPNGQAIRKYKIKETGNRHTTP